MKIYNKDFIECFICVQESTVNFGAKVITILSGLCECEEGAVAAAVLFESKLHRAIHNFRQTEHPAPSLLLVTPCNKFSDIYVTSVSPIST